MRDIFENQAKHISIYSDGELLAAATKKNVNACFFG